MSKGFHFRDICAEDSIKRYPAIGRYDERRTVNSTTFQDIIIHLREIIDLLETYPAYEIAFIDESDSEKLFGVNIFESWWEIKGVIFTQNI